MQKSLGAKSTARRPRPLRALSGNIARQVSELLRDRKPPPPHAAATPAAAADEALDRLLVARSDLACIVSQIDELISDAIRCQTVSKRGELEIQSFNGFLSDTNASLKQWSSRLKQALETDLAKTKNIHAPGTCSSSVAKVNDKLICSTSNLPDTAKTKNIHAPGTCSSSVAKVNDKLICSTSNLPDTDNVASPRSNFTDANMIVSPSPLVSWRAGACTVESGKQLFLLTPLPKTKACSSRCPTSKTHMKTASSTSQLNLPNLPVCKLANAEDDHPNLEQGVKVKEVRTGIITPHVATANKGSLEDRFCSPCTLSTQKSMRALPRSCLKTALSSKQQLFSPIMEGSCKEEINSNGPSHSDEHLESSDEVSKDLASRYDIYGLNQSANFESSDEVSKDLASRYDIYGLKQSTESTYRRREAQDPLQWFLSPLKTCVLMDLPDDKPLPTPARSNMEGKENVSDDKPIQTPAVHSKALLGTPWKGLESTNLKGRKAGENTLKKELWARFEATSTNELHFDKARFLKTDAKCFMDMLEEEAL
ncbi:hypothetical protein U9M48_044678 [Paspalum notatum var. saurae]|uniref:Uncharacterized protein n=1 Tax=Paspalum notatum var. saurae TaxID=547442 RepID=A0AAQ3XJR8_PASNO